MLIIAGVADVAIGVLLYRRSILVSEIASNLSGTSHHERSWRDLRTFGDKRPRRDDAFGPEGGSIQQNRTHADQTPAADATPVQQRHVTDRHIIADERWVRSAHDVNDATVLDVRL